MNIGLIPMSAKPYHIGHHKMIIKAAKENDVVIVFASTSDRKRGEAPGLAGEVMYDVWNKYIIPIMPENVEIRLGGNPVRKVYELTGDANEKRDKSFYRIYSSANDIEKNFPDTSMKKYIGVLFENNQIEMKATKRYTSGTKVRKLLESNDFEGFVINMPEELTTKQIHGLFSLLKKNLI